MQTRRAADKDACARNIMKQKQSLEDSIKSREKKRSERPQVQAVEVMKEYVKTKKDQFKALHDQREQLLRILSGNQQKREKCDENGNEKISLIL